MTARRRKAERPGEILEAAFEEFSRNGFAATRLDDIAARANVTKGTIYVYYSNKEVLFETMVRELMTPVIAEVDDLMTMQANDAEEVLRAFMKFIYTNVAADRQCRELMRLLLLETERFPHLTHEHYTKFVNPMLAKLQDCLNDLAAKGLIRSAPALALPELFSGPAVALNVWRLLFPFTSEINTDQHMEASLDLFLNGLLPRT
ncbi:TetR/AcrR family transcriptional regulator [Roseibium litorale]|uniref:TetR/AcrR family transcriptional regulator n=1 Tax=Roseibium litorale TaxID=2803841 RepID=A0ABR9CSN5_9HYPH|nr:TetR/AcrR family transcriptional regulator [Roseibium litorale]MBD8893896.1 TetR/AcrR family transcriptional regulator [Roseibium litorale]